VNITSFIKFLLQFVTVSVLNIKKVMDFSLTDSEHEEDLYQPVFVREITKLNWDELNESHTAVLQSTRVDNERVNDDDMT